MGYQNGGLTCDDNACSSKQTCDLKCSSGACSSCPAGWTCAVSFCGASCNEGAEQVGGDPNYCQACSDDANCQWNNQNNGLQCDGNTTTNHTKNNCNSGSCNDYTTICESDYGIGASSNCDENNLNTCGNVVGSKPAGYCNNTCIIQDNETSQSGCNCTACGTDNSAPPSCDKNSQQGGIQAPWKSGSYWTGDISGNQYCCGDITAEYPTFRNCSTGICTSDTSDLGCCNLETKCAYSGTCYANGYIGNVDGDSWLEKCKGGSSGQWVDGDAPKYSLNNTNDTEILTTEAVLIYTNWTDDQNLNYSWLSTNETTNWVNYTGGVHGSPIDINLTAGQTWSNYSWQNTTIQADMVVAWRIYANDSENNTNFTEGTFLVHIPDATFAVAMPVNYQFYTINNESENTATNTTPRNISFNFTDIPQYWIQPCAAGDCTNNNQSGINKPIYFIDATGNVLIDIGIKLNQSLPSGLSMCGNSSCTGSCSATSACTAITTNYVQLVNDLSPVEPNRANVTLYANLTGPVTPGETGREILINASYQGKIENNPLVYFDGLYTNNNWKYDGYSLALCLDDKKDKYNGYLVYKWK